MIGRPALVVCGAGAKGPYDVVDAADAVSQLAHALTCDVAETTKIVGELVIVTIGEVVGGVDCLLVDAHRICCPPHAVSLIEGEVVLCGPQPVGADVEVGTEAPARRLKFDDDQPPRPIVDPGPGSTSLLETQWAQDLAGGARHQPCCRGRCRHLTTPNSVRTHRFPHAAIATIVTITSGSILYAAFGSLDAAAAQVPGLKISALHQRRSGRRAQCGLAATGNRRGRAWSTATLVVAPAAPRTTQFRNADAPR